MASHSPEVGPGDILKTSQDGTYLQDMKVKDVMNELLATPARPPGMLHRHHE
jgi:hypothetical protein